MSPRAQSVAVSVAWVLLACVMVLSLLGVELSQNLFAWQSSWTVAASIACAVFVLALGATLALHAVTREPLPLATAVVVSVALFALGLAKLPAEAIEPGTFMGRSAPSPLAYRVALATALALPALALAIGRWKIDAPDAWFRRHASRVVPPLGTLSLALLVVGWSGRSANDPALYARAAQTLGGPSALEAIAELAVATGHAMRQARSIEELLVPEILEQRVREHVSTPPGTREAEHHHRLERFLDSDEVPESIRAEVRTACADGAATHPVRAHTCARDVLDTGRRRAERKRTRFGALVIGGIPIAGLALAFLWRARRATENSRRD